MSARQTSTLIVVTAMVASMAGCADDPAPGDTRADSSESDGGTGDEVGETSATTETDTDTDTETQDESEGSFIPGDTETETSEPEPLSCRDMLECVVGCLGDLGLACLQTCAEGLDPAEAQAAGALVLCLGQQCIEKEQCALDDFTSPACIACIGIGFVLPQPPGCEDQAAACE